MVSGCVLPELPQKGQDSLFDRAEEPPMREDGDDRLDEEEFAAADQDETEEGCAAHRAFRVVEEAEDAGVVELRRVVLDEEVACGKETSSCVGKRERGRLTVKPSERSQRFVGRLRCPDMQTYEKLE